MCYTASEQHPCTYEMLLLWHVLLPVGTLEEAAGPVVTFIMVHSTGVSATRWPPGSPSHQCAARSFPRSARWPCKCRSSACRAPRSRCAARRRRWRAPRSSTRSLAARASSPPSWSRCPCRCAEGPPDHKSLNRNPRVKCNNHDHRAQPSRASKLLSSEQVPVLGFATCSAIPWGIDCSLSDRHDRHDRRCAAAHNVRCSAWHAGPHMRSGGMKNAPYMTAHSSLMSCAVPQWVHI